MYAISPITILAVAVSGAGIYLIFKLLIHFPVMVCLAISSLAVSLAFWYFKLQPFAYLFIFLAVVFLVWRIVWIIKNR